MNNIFILAIGGTGSRVLKSLTFLLASGVRINYNIVPIIIDPDEAGGDKNRTETILKNYQNIYNEIDQNDAEKAGSFFRNKITTLGEEVAVSGEANGAVANGDFVQKLSRINDNKFKDFIGYSELNSENKAFTSLLFSDKNLESDLIVGFKGNPNMGSVVLNQIASSEIFENMASVFREGDRVFIISSIFGGTGAAGFPLLLKNIRKGHPKIANDFFSNSPIGALSVLPYFNLKSDDESEIDSNGFIAKTKAALAYYDRSISKDVNALYYIGDRTGNIYENNEGGGEQKNDAHIIELLGALAIIDFANARISDLDNVFKEFALAEDTDRINFTHFGQTKNVIAKDLVSYFYFLLFNKYSLKQQQSQPFSQMSGQNFDDSFFSKSFYQTLAKFNNEFEIWLGEIARNERSFSPFDIQIQTDSQNNVTGLTARQENIFTLINDMTAKKRFFSFKGKDFYEIIAALNSDAKRIGQVNNVNTRFLKVLSTSLKNIIEEKYY